MEKSWGVWEGSPEDGRPCRPVSLPVSVSRVPLPTSVEEDEEWESSQSREFPERWVLEPWSGLRGTR